VLAITLKDNPMKLASRIKPVSYFLENSGNVIAQLANDTDPLVLTCEGEACAVITSPEAYDKITNRIHELEEKMAMLQLLAMSEKEFAAGQFVALEDLERELEELDLTA
jgi:PHD/YefM family antitoxin component YafN of YafNO toxin-antitoxin module